MKIKIGQAVKMFFGNSSLEMVYSEAIANALDAGANEIDVKIKLDALNKPDSLEIEIIDNGEGFTDVRFDKFCKLLDVEEKSHKGLGRLVYLFYFGLVNIVSFYHSTKRREFDFNEEFDEKSVTADVEARKSGTHIKMTKYELQKIAKNDYIDPKKIKIKILEEFYPRLFRLNENNTPVVIRIEAVIDGHPIFETLNSAEIPTFQTISINSPIALFDTFDLYYSINKVEADKTSMISAIAVDDRTLPVELISNDNYVTGYEMVFLLFSEYFKGRVDPSRQSLNMSLQDQRDVQNLFRKVVVSIIENNISTVKTRNEGVKKSLINKFPHLNGYFDTQNIGYIKRIDVLKKAQDEFFKDQRELLEATSLSEEQYDKSLEVSSRALTEYILFRQLAINKLKKSTSENSEAELHKLFASMRSEGKFEKENQIDDIYRNNAWLLDDKFMTYETLLSDREMGELVAYITDGEVERDENRVDIAIVFSNDPELKKPFDVVIVELKKRGLSLEDNMKVVTQIEKRARKLMQFYKNQIQRIWFYGIIEIYEEVELALAGEYKELYSSGKMYYRETEVAIALNPKITLPIGVFIWDLDAVISDADSRNSTFLNLIKSKFIE